MGSTGGGGSGSNTVTEKLLPDYAKHYVIKYMKRAKTLADPNNYEYDAEYNGDTYAEQHAYETEGITALSDRARNGSTIVAKGIDVLESIFDGTVLTENSTLDDLYEKESEALTQEFTEEILPDIDNEAVALLMVGSSGHQIQQAKASERVLKALLGVGRDIYHNDYETARDMQNNVLDDGIVYGHESIRDNELLRQAGLYQREYKQGKKTDKFNKWKAEQDIIIKKLEILGNAIRAVIGAQVTKTEPFYRVSPISQIAGLALAGAGMMASIYGKSPSSTRYANTGGASTPMQGTTEQSRLPVLEMKESLVTNYNPEQ